MAFKTFEQIAAVSYHKLEGITRITVTGHRPIHIGGYNHNNPIRIAIKECFKEFLIGRPFVEAYAPYEIDTLLVNTGMALGVDQDLAWICHKHNVPFHAYIPCKDHSKMWLQESKDSYDALLRYAADIRNVSNEPYDDRCMQRRNKAMVDRCEVVFAVWNGTPGGTANCVRYAQSLCVPVWCYNPNTTEFGLLE